MIWVLYVAGCTGQGTATSDPADDLPSDPSDPPGTSDPTDGTDGPTYWADIQPIVAENCIACHRENDVAPFSLETAEQAIAWGEAMRLAVEDGTMPPWPPSTDGCLPLEGVRALAADQIATIGAWVDAGMPEGDPADGITVPEPEVFDTDVVLPMTEAYTPKALADDYRCFLVEWPLDEAAYVTGYEVEPGRRDLVHHVILSTVTGAGANQARSLDENEPGPGYTCFGSSGVLGAATLGAWVPGVKGIALPENTGIRVERGTTMIVQVHYNTTVTPEPEADLTSVAFRTVPTVEKPAAALLVVDPLWLFGGMDIPAGESSVVHEGTFSGASLARMASVIGADPGEPLQLHRVGLHMHLLGQHATLSVERADGTSDCVLDIPRWDFHWQGSYELTEPLSLAPDDQLRLRCEWDNSAPGATDVNWGEGTSDEMCLTGIYVTR